jgi:hypothetical protein
MLASWRLVEVETPFTRGVYLETGARAIGVGCAFFDRNVHSRMPLNHTPAGVKPAFQASTRVTDGMPLERPHLTLLLYYVSHY